MRSLFVRRMLLGLEGQLAFVTPLARGDREWHGTSNAQAKKKGSRQLHFLGATYASTLEFMERRFLDRDTVRCNPDGLVLFEPRKNRDEIDMEVTEHACPKVSVLGLGAVVIREDVTKRTSFRGADEGPTLAGVTHEEVEFPGVTDQPPCQQFSVSLAALGKLADNGPSDIAVLGKSDLGFLLEGDHRLPDLERPQQARLNEERQERRRGPTAAREMPSVPCRDHRIKSHRRTPIPRLQQSRCQYLRGEGH